MLNNKRPRCRVFMSPPVVFNLDRTRSGSLRAERLSSSGSATGTETWCLRDGADGQAALLECSVTLLGETKLLSAAVPLVVSEEDLTFERELGACRCPEDGPCGYRAGTSQLLGAQRPTA